jgi:hypothetical protein
MLGSRALPLPLLVGRLRVAHSPQYAWLHVSFRVQNSVTEKKDSTYVTASLDDPDLLLHLVLCNSQLVATIWAHHFLVFRRTACETFCGRWWGFVLGRCWLHNAKTHVESGHLVIHHDIGYGNLSWSPTLAARLLSSCSALSRSLYLLFELHSVRMGSVMTAPSRESMSHDFCLVVITSAGERVRSLEPCGMTADVLHKTAQAKIAAATWRAIAGADSTTSHSWWLGVDTG